MTLPSGKYAILDLAGCTISCSSIELPICVNGTLTLQGSGNITNAYSEGVGVYVDEGSFTMNGGTVSATDIVGRGVVISHGNFTMNDGTASGRRHGVYVYGDSFTMNGGIVSGGEESSRKDIYINDGSFLYYDGIITHNNIGGGRNVYDITAAVSGDGGTVSAPKRASEGASVPVTVSPDGGKALDKLTYTYEGLSAPVDITTSKSFTMPDAAVTVTATFKEASSGITSNGLKYTLDENGNATVIGFASDVDPTGTLTIPSIIDETYPVIAIGESAFEGCFGLTGSLTISNSMKSIGASAFKGCFGFSENLTIGSSVESIGASAFEECYGFTGSVTIPNSVKSIGESAFEGCYGLKGNLTLGTSLESIGASAFKGCFGLTGGLTIGSSVTTIGSYAFHDCFGLANVTFPNSVQTIGDYAFNNCTGLKNLTIPSGVETIGTYAFEVCDHLESVTIEPDWNLQTIGGGAFAGCKELRWILFPGTEKQWENIGGLDANPENHPVIYVNEVTCTADPAEGGTVKASMETTAAAASISAWSQYTVTLTVTPKDSNYLLDSLAVTYTDGQGQTQTITPQKDENDTTNTKYTFIMPGYPVTVTGTFKLKSYNVTCTANLEEGGTVTGGGTYNHGEKATVTAIPNDGYVFDCWTENGTRIDGAGVEYSFTVEGARNLTANFRKVIISDIRDQVYTGDPITPAISDSDISFDGVDYSVQGKDYVLTYDKNVNAGKGTVTVTFSGAFSGEASKTFNILPAGISIAKVEVEDQKYTGKELMPEPTVTWNDKALVKDTDYTLSYADNINEGEATVTVTGKGNFIGEVRGTFTILPPTAYTISCTANPTAGGTVTGGGAYNENATATLTATANEGYDFVNWTENGTEVSTEATYKFTIAGTRTLVANFALKQYTITWQMDDGSLIDTTTVDHGQMPTHADPTKQATAGKTYVFSGWEPNVVAATGEATYKAVFSDTTNSYTITWQMDDGSVIDTTTVEYGKVPTHAEPIKAADADFTYTFAGWLPEVTAVTGEATYQAVFIPVPKEQYLVIWLNGDGSELDRKTYREGEAEPKTDKVPAKAADAGFTYTFDKWDAGTKDGNLTVYRPQFTATAIVPVASTVYYFESGTTPYMWYKGNAPDITLVVHRQPDDPQAFTHFQGIQVGGKVLSPRLYTAYSGSVIIVPSRAYLNSLDVGSYTVIAAFDDGQAETKFVVLDAGSGGTYYSTSTSERYTYVPPSNNPRTGDESNLTLWGSLAAASLAGAVLTVKKRKRKTGDGSVS